MTLLLTEWIRKPIPFERRDMLDFMFWNFLIMLFILTYIIYLIFPILLFLVFTLIIMDLRLLIINNSIAMKEIKEKKARSKLLNNQKDLNMVI